VPETELPKPMTGSRPKAGAQQGRQCIAICLEYPITQAGGVSVLSRVLAENLAQDYEVILVSPDSLEALRADPIWPHLKQHLLYDPHDASPQAARDVAARISEAGADLAHFHFGGTFGWHNSRPGRCPIPLLRRLGVPVITTVHMTAGLLQGFADPRKPLWFKLARLPLAWGSKIGVLRSVTREITVSRHDYHWLRRWYWPVRGRFAHIYHSRVVRSAGLRQPAENPGMGAGASAVQTVPRDSLILAVGHIAHRKGQAVLAEAFARIATRYPGWRLWLAGHVGEESCKKLIEESAGKCAKADQICLLGQRADVAELMQRAAVFVQPSFHEGLPLALQEALYYGCACLATRIPGNSELITSEINGLLVPRGNPEAMARALERLLSDGQLRQRLADAGPASLVQKEMTIEMMIARHQRVYQLALRP
jgi:glycosyltransferase involved in cell wall biosynthesis